MEFAKKIRKSLHKYLNKSCLVQAFMATWRLIVIKAIKDTLEIKSLCPSSSGFTPKCPQALELLRRGFAASYFSASQTKRALCQERMQLPAKICQRGFLGMNCTTKKSLKLI